MLDRHNSLLLSLHIILAGLISKNKETEDPQGVIFIQPFTYVKKPRL